LAKVLAALFGNVYFYCHSIFCILNKKGKREKSHVMSCKKIQLPMFW